jgi:hypothetical protein
MAQLRELGGDKRAREHVTARIFSPSMLSSAPAISRAERAYIAAALPRRGDGRGPGDMRPVALATGVVPLANGSARARAGGTDVTVAVKLEADAAEAGSIVCAVSWCVPIGRKKKGQELMGAKTARPRRTRTSPGPRSTSSRTTSPRSSSRRSATRLCCPRGS